MINLTNILKSGFICMLLPLFIACSGVKLIGAYNENVDESIQVISKDISILFAAIENNIDDSKDFSYSTLRDSYTKIEGEIESCTTVAKGLPKYNIILKQLNLLKGQVAKLKADHRAGFVLGTTDKETLKKAVNLDKSGFEVALGAMMKLQEGLKREKSE